MRRNFDLELKALREQEELQARLEKLRREAKEIEIAGLQEEMARKTKIAEKEIERAKVSRSCGSSFRNISPVGTPDDNLMKVSGWMDKTEEAENVASSTNVPPGYQQTSVSAPVIAVRAGLSTGQILVSAPVYSTINSRRTILRASEGLETLSATDHIHRSR